jgi:hypothetical protein
MATSSAAGLPQGVRSSSTNVTRLSEYVEVR